MRRAFCLWLFAILPNFAHDVPWVHDNIPDDADGDGMADTWEVNNNLNPNHPSDSEQDADLDGFTNREEFKNKTDPHDSNEHPEWFTKLFVKDISHEGLRITMLPETNSIPFEAATFTWSGKSYTTRGLTEDGVLVLETGMIEPRFLPAQSRRIALKINRIRRATTEK